eukprot:gnl/Chilomastix_cuspidata/1257.p1 GENE.gnl/Chilomastix_cuspidata/1257~~gnl/Chilomastix_cuspidata/1257.p1  ORF type:complete len:774 (+),score=372.02 gnl/Chilomastix_cuspidata/1257:1254-3575(+)
MRPSADGTTSPGGFAGKLSAESPPGALAESRGQALARRSAEKAQRRTEALRRAAAPRNVGFLAISPSLDVHAVIGSICAHKSTIVNVFPPDDQSEPRTPGLCASGAALVSVPNLRAQLNALALDRGDEPGLTRSVQVLDLLVLVVDAKVGTDEAADHAIAMLRNQGMPTVLGLVVGADAERKKKRRKELLWGMTRFFKTFGDGTKVVPEFSAPPTAAQVEKLVRVLCTTNAQPMQWVSRRPAMLVQTVRCDAGGAGAVLSGFLRGQALSPNNPVHVHGVGDFQVDAVLHGADPCPLIAARTALLRGARELPFEEPSLPHAVVANDTRVDLRRRADADAADAADAAEGSCADSEAGAAGAEEMCAPGAEPADESTESSEDFSEDDSEDLGANDARDAMLVPRARDDMEFPDEVDTPISEPAERRFMKYRGLKSLRTSPWVGGQADLPPAVARLFNVRDPALVLRREQARAAEGGVQPGQWVSVRLAAADEEARAALLRARRSGRPVLLLGLYSVECKDVVNHFRVRRADAHAQFPLENKRPLLVRYGLRSVLVRPALSTPVAKGKWERYKLSRFMHPDEFVIVSAVCPIHLGAPPVAVLDPAAAAATRLERPPPVAFDEARMVSSPHPLLLATGKLLRPDSRRLLVKRVILTGYPVKIHRRKCVVRYMFFNRRDVKYFRPVELTTKQGKTGNIMKPVGEHGRFRAYFNQPVNHGDTIMLKLYRRVFPPFDEAAEVLEARGDAWAEAARALVDRYLAERDEKAHRERERLEFARQ